MSREGGKLPVNFSEQSACKQHVLKKNPDQPGIAGSGRKGGSPPLTAIDRHTLGRQRKKLLKRGKKGGKPF